MKLKMLLLLFLPFIGLSLALFKIYYKENPKKLLKNVNKVDVFDFKENDCFLISTPDQKMVHPRYIKILEIISGKYLVLETISNGKESQVYTNYYENKDLKAISSLRSSCPKFLVIAE